MALISILQLALSLFKAINYSEANSYIYQACISPKKVTELNYPKENRRRRDIPLLDFELIHLQMIQIGKHADLSYLWLDYKKQNPDGYQLSQFYKVNGKP